MPVNLWIALLLDFFFWSEMFLKELSNLIFSNLFIYYVILFAIVPGELQRDSAIHILVSKLPSHPACHITLSRVPCVVQ